MESLARTTQSRPFAVAYAWCGFAVMWAFWLSFVIFLAEPRQVLAWWPLPTVDRPRSVEQPVVAGLINLALGGPLQHARRRIISAERGTPARPQLPAGVAPHDWRAVLADRRDWRTGCPQAQQRRVVPLLIALGFALAAITVMLVERYGQVTAYWLVAVGLAAIGSIAAIAVSADDPMPSALRH
jgi:hypothetical protein